MSKAFHLQASVTKQDVDAAADERAAITATAVAQAEVARQLAAAGFGAGVKRTAAGLPSRAHGPGVSPSVGPAPTATTPSKQVVATKVPAVQTRAEKRAERARLHNESVGAAQAAAQLPPAAAAASFATVVAAPALAAPQVVAPVASAATAAAAFLAGPALAQHSWSPPPTFGPNTIKAWIDPTHRRGAVEHFEWLCVQGGLGGAKGMPCPFAEMGTCKDPSTCRKCKQQAERAQPAVPPPGTVAKVKAACTPSVQERFRSD